MAHHHRSSTLGGSAGRAQSDLARALGPLVDAFPGRPQYVPSRNCQRFRCSGAATDDLLAIHRLARRGWYRKDVVADEGGLFIDVYTSRVSTVVESTLLVLLLCCACALVGNLLVCARVHVNTH